MLITRDKFFVYVDYYSNLNKSKIFKIPTWNTKYTIDRRNPEIEAFDSWEKSETDHLTVAFNTK